MFETISNPTVFAGILAAGVAFIGSFLVFINTGLKNRADHEIAKEGSELSKTTVALDALSQLVKVQGGELEKLHARLESDSHRIDALEEENARAMKESSRCRKKYQASCAYILTIWTLWSGLKPQLDYLEVDYVAMPEVPEILRDDVFAVSENITSTKSPGLEEID